MKTYFAVTGIVKHMDKVLILKKSPNDWNYPGKWSFCSGYVKEFEAAEDTALREIKDFAMPIYIQINGEREIFWRWYMLSEDDAVKEIKTILEKEEQEAKLPVVEEVKETEDGEV